MRFTFLFVFLFLILFGSFGQQGNPDLFGQCLIYIESSEEMLELEADLRQNPYVKVARLDHQTQRVFILTKNIESLQEEEFISWFNEYAEKISCIQIGRIGVDVVKPYPFEGCEKITE